MTNAYRWVQWNRHKAVYDRILGAIVVGYLALFLVIGAVTPAGGTPVEPVRLLIAATGTLALVLLHVALSIGPVARIWPRAMPLLYNRRHLGVVLFLVALAHAALVLFWYGASGVEPAITAVFAGPVGFPALGLAALAILFAMAATSHDFWLATLGPAAWKTLHMGVYGAYALAVAHVAFGVMQDNADPLLVGLILAGVVWLAAVHTIAGARERAADRGASPDAEGWLDAGAVDDIPHGRAAVVVPRGGERIAVFRHDGGFSAVTNVCAHQGGPVGEGRILDGCITCPWHGYQYRPEEGCSPPPYTERIATYPVRLRGGRVEVRTTALPPGTRVPPAHPAGGGETPHA